MNLHEARQVVESRGPNGDPRDVFGQQYQTPDGATIIAVSKPVGVFVVKDGKPIWEPATDATRIALMGILVGLASVTLAGLAMVRRPPWPDLYGDMSKSL